MKRTAVASIAVAMVVFSGGLAAQADTGPIGGGTSLSVTLSSPLDGESYVAGSPVPVAGTVELGEGAAVKDTDLVFVLDVSGSTTNGSLDCGNVLECEKAAVLDIVEDADSVRSPIAKVGVVSFPTRSAVPLTSPGAFTNDLSAFTPGGGTEFEIGIENARVMLAAESDATKDLMVLFTDGDGSYQPPVTGIADMVIKVFTIGGATCNAALQQVVIDGADDSSCTPVTSLDQLAGIVSDTIGSTLDRIDITVGTEIVQTLLDVPTDGPTTVPFSATLNGLVAGNDQTVCAVATATDAGGSGSVSDCATIDVLPAGTVIIDCEGDSVCTGTATDPGKSTLAFSAESEFDEPVTIAPDSGGPTSCGGTTCKTGYSVGFLTNNPNGPVATITVVTANKVSLKDRLNAAVYIDGTRITAQCNNRKLIAHLRNKLGIPEPIPCITITYQSNGRLEYFVKFNADPVFRFR